jgi:hypothetical protein
MFSESHSSHPRHPSNPRLYPWLDSLNSCESWFSPWGHASPSLDPRTTFIPVRCETGYLCDVCGGDVENIWDSDLYLRYVIGQVDPETLHTTRERHIRCNPTLAQFIVDPDFEPVAVEGPFDKHQLDANYVREQERLITRGWRRLKELAHQEGVSLLDYPLPEIRRQMHSP